MPGPGPAAPPPAAAAARRVHPRGLTVHVRRAYRVSGRVLLPAGLRAAQACGSGVVAVTAKSAARTVSTRVTRLRAGCGYAARVRFARRPRHLRFRARFFGSRALYGLSGRSTPGP